MERERKEEKCEGRKKVLEIDPKQLSTIRSLNVDIRMVDIFLTCVIRLFRLGEVLFCERSELRGSGGQRVARWSFLGHLGCRRGYIWGNFSRVCTMRQVCDGRVRFPLGPSQKRTGKVEK